MNYQCSPNYSYKAQTHPPLINSDETQTLLFTNNQNNRKTTNKSIFFI
ncbi:MAG: hypothetical protein ACTSWL_03325 [Promethearchaeota archaeon]